MVLYTMYGTPAPASIERVYKIAKQTLANTSMEAACKARQDGKWEVGSAK